MCRWRPFVWSFGVCVLLADQASAQMLTETEALARMRMEHPQVYDEMRRICDGAR